MSVFAPSPFPTTEYTIDDDRRGPLSYIPESKQTAMCIGMMGVGGFFIAIALVMSQPKWPGHKCLNDWLGCSCLGACFAACNCCRKRAVAPEEGKNIESALAEERQQQEFGWLIRYFGWMEPIGPEGSEVVIFQQQLGLLIWKSITVKGRQTNQMILHFMLPALILFMSWLLYETFTMDDNGIFEMITFPFAFIMVLQLTTVSIVSEKSLRLFESMRMMGLRDLPYWISYFLVDGILMGFLLSFFLATLTVAFDLLCDVGWFECLWFYWTYCLALTALSFVIAAVIDSPQTAGQVSFFTLISGVVLFLVVILSEYEWIVTRERQKLWCLFPPMAVEIGIYAQATFNLPYNDNKLTLNEVSSFLLLDVVIFCFVAWYLSQVLPSEFGVQRKPWFLFQPSYWTGAVDKKNLVGEEGVSASPLLVNEQSMEDGANAQCPTEVVDPVALGDPTVSVRSLFKTFGNFKAVNGLTFDLYDGQIFSLLGHNGAGKTTTINMLTGLFAPDAASGNTTIYGHSILSAMSAARKVLGICPQHDVLFEQLTCREHIAFFSLLKGYTDDWATAGREADDLLEHFHLHERAHYVGGELSGGMKRKLSTAVALCGGSKFVVLDEPTAGMDPLARRELWDLLKSVRHGRTMLLTTHYMDEADVLGDRIAIMSRGVLQCIGSSTFLKRTFGAGYKLIATLQAGTLQASEDDVVPDIETHSATRKLLDFVAASLPGSQLARKECTVNSLVFVLPFDRVSTFGEFFTRFDGEFSKFGVEGYGVTITDLEEVFLRVGEDHTLGERDVSAIGQGQMLVADGGPAGVGAGGEGAYDPTIWDQVYGLWWKRMASCVHDAKTIPLVGLPVAVSIVAFLCNVEGWLGKRGSFGANIATAAIIFAGYIPMPGLLAENVVAERTTRLRNVLTVMGCQLKSYWLGNFLGDFTLFMFTAVCIWIVAVMCIALQDTVDDDSSPSNNFYGNTTSAEDDDSGDLSAWLDFGGLFFFVPLFGLQLVSFSYACSFGFASPRLAIVFMPFLALLLIFVPLILITMFLLAFGDNGAGIVSPGQKTIAGAILWGTTLCSPHAAFGLGLASISSDIADQVSSYPPFTATCAIMLIESVLFLVAAYRVDRQSVVPMEAKEFTPKPAQLADLDEDVLQERDRVLAMAPDEISSGDTELRLAGLRKVFPPKTPTGKPLQAVQSLSVGLPKGEVFGLLGANGAGKTTAISMVMRVLFPTAGNIHICGNSVLDEFGAASKHLGVVTQHNTLWDRLSCIDHLRLFARLRGVPREMVEPLVQATIKDMELEPYKDRLAMRLSGGMKRKLCVAIALIGDPKVVLLDEPSAGLDPVSRRNLWDVILRTMATRSVVLTTHSMEEAEALCSRIGIVVKGQLRVLGSPQHLKNKYGSGYEIILQSKAADEASAAASSVRQSEMDRAKSAELLTFVQGMFADASLLSDNGGLATFRVPPESMRVGAAFDALEANKDRLGITDYSLAQPTLEQVFVRTVMEHSGNERPAGEANGRRSTSQSSPWVRASLGEDGGEVNELVQANAKSPRLSAQNSADEFDFGLHDYDATGGLRTTFLGCSAKAHRFLTFVMCFLAVFCFISITGLLGPPSYDDDHNGERCHHADDEQPCSVYGFYLNAFPLLFAVITMITAICGCCCCIPVNPEDEKD